MTAMMTIHPRRISNSKTGANGQMLQRRQWAAVVVLACSMLSTSAWAEYGFSANGEEVTDLASGIVWRRCSEGMAWSGTTCTGAASVYRHEAALAHAKTQAASSGKPWRVPNVKELSSITNLGLSVSPSIDMNAFPVTPAYPFWSSTPFVPGGGVNAYWVSFDDGYVNLGHRLDYHYLRLVR